MLIFENQNKYYIYIHIPKNSGKYIREKTSNNKNNKILQNYWGIKDTLDLAHIPYLKKNFFIENNIDYNYFTYTRCPYDRIISSFFYRNGNKNIDDFKYFVKNTLVLYNFDINFYYEIIHYYPQYLFICDENLEIHKSIKIDKLEDYEKPKKYDLIKYFDDECINIINNIYSNDFLFFNYKKILI
jgi:hypothetical protein